MEETPLEEGWIKHVPGDPCPCAPDQLIHVLFDDGWRSDGANPNPARASVWIDYLDNWKCLTDTCSIIAWRPVGWEYKPEPKAPKCGEWYPIETAPKDGSRFLIYEPFEPTVESAWIDEEGYLGPCTLRTPFWQKPTHWTPLPSPPQP